MNYHAVVTDGGIDCIETFSQKEENTFNILIFIFKQYADTKSNK